MRSLLGLMALLAVGCTHYEWVQDYQVPGTCPSEKPVPATPRPVLGLEAGAVRGRVIGRGSRSPISGVVGFLTGGKVWQGRTDTAGYFRVDSVQAGRYLLVVRGLGFESWRDTVEVIRGPAHKFQIQLEPAMWDGPCSGYAMVWTKKRRMGR